MVKIKFMSAMLTLASAATVLAVSGGTAQAASASDAKPSFSASTASPWKPAAGATPLAKAEKCYYDHAAQSGHLGKIVLWRLEQEVVYCVKSGKLTSLRTHIQYFSHHAGSVTVNTPTGTLTKFEPTHWVYRSTGKVTWCPALHVKCFHYDPWIKLDMKGSGASTAAGGF